MILKRQEKDNLIKAMYSSSNILASIYDTNTNDITLIFNKGGQYKYPNVKVTDYTRFEIADSQGAVFNSHIKPYSFEKLAAIDPKLIVEEIEHLKKEEKKVNLTNKQNRIVEVMKSLISIHEAPSGNTFTEGDLAKLAEAVTAYLTEIRN